MSERNKHSKILLVVSSYLPNRGGLQTVTSQLAMELQRREFLVSVLAQRYPRTLAPMETIDGISVQRFWFYTPLVRDLKRKRLDLFLASLFFFPITMVRLVWRILHEKPDVINFHFIGAPAPFLILARRWLRFRFVVSMHGDDVEGLSRGTWFDTWVFRTVLRQADVVTACSKYLLDMACSVEPAIVSKARVVYNGIHPQTQFGGIPGNTIFAAGRMVPKKGLHILLRAVAECRQRGCDVRLELVGDGPERGKLESLTQELELTPYVTFAGLQDHAQVVDRMRTSRLVVVPSRQEPFGMVALEAMAVGKPVIVTRVGGLPEVVQDADAMVVEPEDPISLADAMLKMLERLDMEPALGSKNRELANRFSVSHMVDEYLAAYAG